MMRSDLAITVLVLLTTTLLFTTPFVAYWQGWSKVLSMLVITMPSSMILLEDFDHPSHTWEELNDPVMGGKSQATFSVQDGVATFAGRVAIVPFLRKPGFVQARTVDHGGFPDVSSCRGIQLTIRSLVDYEGYRFSFGDARAPHGKFYARGYKTDLKNIPSGNLDFVDVVLPFDSFTDYWDDATGDAIVTCRDNALYCPTKEALKDLKTMAIWGEGVQGEIHVQIKRIVAIDCMN